MATPGETLGLRERKNRRTKRAIVEATVDLTLEGGYAAATIPRIAERADVSPRTVSTWFPAKDDILFEGLDEVIARATVHLRDDAGDVLDRMQAWIRDEADRDHAALDAELTELRGRAVDHDPELRARERQLFDRVQSEIAEVVARDLGIPPQDMGPQLFADAAMAMLLLVRAAGLEGRVDQAEARLASGFRFLRAALATLEADAA